MDLVRPLDLIRSSFVNEKYRFKLDPILLDSINPICTSVLYKFDNNSN